jgi:hypothetical protein
VGKTQGHETWAFRDIMTSVAISFYPHSGIDNLHYYFSIHIVSHSYSLFFYLFVIHTIFYSQYSVFQNYIPKRKRT